MSSQKRHDGLVPITQPDIGAADEIIRVCLWLTELGENVVAGEPLVEVAIKGATFDVEAPASGVLSQITCCEDDEIQPGETLGWISPAATMLSDDAQEKTA